MICCALNQGSSTAFSGAQLLSHVVGAYLEPIFCSDAVLGDISFEVVHLGGEVRFHDLGMNDCRNEGDATDLAAPICDDHVEIDVQVSINSDDGRLDEVWEAALSSTDGEIGEVNIDELQPASLHRDRGHRP